MLCSVMLSDYTYLQTYLETQWFLVTAPTFQNFMILPSVLREANWSSKNVSDLSVASVWSNLKKYY